VFVRPDWKSLPMTNTSLLRKSVIYGQKKSYNIGPSLQSINNKLVRLLREATQSEVDVRYLKSVYSMIPFSSKATLNMKLAK
jgi:hypothetical protein